MGNVDPGFMLSFERPVEVEEESGESINNAGMSGSLILSSGCSVPAMTPPENLEAMVRAAKEG
jgi:uroporphyrinogen-III decarboxylase